MTDEAIQAKTAAAVYVSNVHRSLGSLLICLDLAALLLRFYGISVRWLLLVVTILMVLGSIPNGAGTMVLLFLVHFLLPHLPPCSTRRLHIFLSFVGGCYHDSQSGMYGNKET